MYIKLALLSSHRKLRAHLVFEQEPFHVGRIGCCPVRATGASLPCGRYLLAPLTGSVGVMVLRVKSTPTFLKPQWTIHLCILYQMCPCRHTHGRISWSAPLTLEVWRACTIHVCTRTIICPTRCATLHTCAWPPSIDKPSPLQRQINKSLWCDNAKHVRWFVKKELPKNKDGAETSVQSFPLRKLAIGIWEWWVFSGFYAFATIIHSSVN